MLLAYLEFTFHPPHRTLLTILVVVLCALPWRRWARFPVLGGRWPAVAVVFLVSLVCVSSLAWKRGLPLPYVHDEFSYLLAGDTFARGRLANPVHSHWEHFESMHILVRPSYQSKYPPGQGLSLAVGQLIGHPIYGVWLTTACAAAAICWMLSVFGPVRYALVAGLVVALHPQTLEWGQRYWGGSLPMLGGALLMGGISVSHRRPTRPAGSLVAAVGLLILANTRPYEGLILAVAVGIFWFMERRQIDRPAFSAAVPALALLGLGGVWMGYYNHRVTGSFMRLPYAEHQSQYAATPLFLFQSPPAPPEYRHNELARFYLHDQTYAYRKRDSWGKGVLEALNGLDGLRLCFMGAVEVIALPLLLLPWLIWKSRRVRGLMVVLVVFAAGLLVETFLFGHYAAPAVGAVMLLWAICFRHLSRLGRPIGPYLARVTVALTLMWSLFWWKNFYDWEQEGFAVQRQELQQQLEREPGRHLVLVRYPAGHDVHQEWVYNEADIDGAKVVWAREMDEARNRRLVEYFSGRRVWIVQPGPDGARVNEVTTLLKRPMQGRLQPPAGRNPRRLKPPLR